jgi:S1-C subfamily serine protease
VSILTPAKESRLERTGEKTGAGVLSPNDIYPRLMRSTVLIARENGGWGTGWIIDRKQKLVVTNHHVIAGANGVTVYFPAKGQDGKWISEQKYYVGNNIGVGARVLDSDPSRDLALLQIQAVPDEISELTLASGSPQPGDRVHSVGNPGASDALWVYSSGTVRQVYQKDLQYPGGQKVSAKVVETSSPINPGDSGGPVVNDKGELVGVTSGLHRDARLISWCIDVGEVKAFMSR